MTVTVNKAIDAYLRLRRQKEDIERKAKEEVAVLRQSMDKIETYIKVQADAQGVTSFKTDNGTAFVTTTDYASVADWDAVLEYIKENDAYDMLERRVSKHAVRGRIEADNAVPPGINFGTKLTVNVRKATTKVED